jgi:hypothetical protein
MNGVHISSFLFAGCQILVACAEENLQRAIFKVHNIIN